MILDPAPTCLEIPNFVDVNPSSSENPLEKTSLLNGGGGAGIRVRIGPEGLPQGERERRGEGGREGGAGHISL